MYVQGPVQAGDPADLFSLPLAVMCSAGAAKRLGRLTAMRSRRRAGPAQTSRSAPASRSRRRPPRPPRPPKRLCRMEMTAKIKAKMAISTPREGARSQRPHSRWRRDGDQLFGPAPNAIAGSRSLAKRTASAGSRTGSRSRDKRRSSGSRLRAQGNIQIPAPRLGGCDAPPSPDTKSTNSAARH